MIHASDEPEDLDPLLRAIPRILHSSSFAASIQEALELLRRGSRADASVLFLADGDAPLREHWAPDNAAVKAALRPRLKVEALAAIREGGRHLEESDGETQDGCATRTVLLCTETGPLGAVALAWSAKAAPGHPKVRAWILAVIGLAASVVISQSEISKLRSQAERDKRWFKTLDDHLRTLDRERQKFAAVVNQTDTFVFVTDEERIIRWNNRAMAVLLPFDNAASSWVGKPCSEACSRLGQGSRGSHPCDCPIRKALEKNEVAHQELRLSLRGTPGVLYLTALPIKGLDGKPREAMVLIQDLTGLETLRQSEIRYSVLFDRNPEAILMVDPDTQEILIANPAAHRMLGYSAQEIAKLKLESLHTPEEWERMAGFYRVEAERIGPSKAQCRVLTHEGTERVALVSSTRVPLEEKNLDLVELVDVTASLQVELALGESEARQGAMIRAALDAIISMDHAGRIVEFNPAAEQIFGWEREDALGRDMADLIIPPELRDRHRRALHQYLATGEGRLLGRRIEITALRADGSRFPIELAITRISSQGPPVFTGFIRDLSEQKGAVEALRTSEERLRTVIGESPIAVFALDRNGIYTVSAGKGLARLGRREGEAVGKSVYEMYRDHPQALANIDRCLAGEEFSDSVDVGEVAFEVHYMPVRNDQGEVTGIFGVATDVTERRSLETQLRHAQKMEAIGRLAGGVAHDFNNLLTVIQGHSEMLLAKMTPREALRPSVEEIHKAGSRGVLLTRQLLAFSRKHVSSPEILDLGEVVRGMENMLHRLLGEEIRLVTRIGSWPLHVRADRGQLEQVLANLAVNARDAMESEGEVVVEVSACDLPSRTFPRSSLSPGPYVALTMSDQGCGMSTEILGHLFEPFFTTKEVGKGTGLGLSVVYGIVRQAGGDIQVESEPGRGATFRILLPRIEGVEPAASGAMAGEATEPAQGHGLILLVEDEPQVRALARDMLQALGYDVVEAASGEEALTIFERQRGSIRGVVSDVVMPGMNGVELLRRLIAAQPDLKALLVSGYAKDSVEQFEKEGFAFLSKPYTLEDFARRISEMLAGSSVGDQKDTS